MTLSNRRPGSQFFLIACFSAFVAFSLLPVSADAQAPQFTCRPNTDGDGWICERADSAGDESLQRAPDPDSSDDGVATPAPVQQQDSEPQTPALSATEEVETEEPSQSTPTPETEPESFAVVAAPESLYPLDWVPQEAMTAEQRANMDRACCGAFVDPVVELPTDDEETRFTAPGGFSQLNQNLINIDGDVVVRQGNRSIENNLSTSIDREANTVLMDGDVVFREPGVLLTGNSAFINNESEVSRVEAANYVLHDYGVHGEAEVIVYNSESGLVSIENGAFSRCEPGSEFWQLRANNMLLDQSAGRGYAEAVSLRLGGVPVFYYPFTLPFPLGDERASGFLAPSIGSTRTGGADFELPYYFNLAPHYDATLSPRLISDRGVLTSAEFRYLADWSMNTLNMSYLGGDRLFDAATVDIPGSDSPPKEDRWFIGFEHFGSIGRHWSTFIDYNGVSDEDYFYDLGSSGLNVASRTHLNRQGVVSFSAPWLQASLNVQRIQLIDPFVAANDLNQPYDRLPQFNFATDYSLPGGFHIGLAGEVTAFSRDLNESLFTPEQIADGALVEGTRFNLEPELGWSLESPGWFVRATAKYKHLSYDLDDQAMGTADDPDVNVPVYTLDGGLIFDRALSSGGTQTLEPRLYYLYSEFEDQSLLPRFDSNEMGFSFYSLFRDDRFSGGDRIGDADQLAIALTTRFLSDSGAERGRFSLGQIHYFEDRRVSLSNPAQTWLPNYSTVDSESALVSEFALALGDHWWLGGDVQWNQETEDVDEGSFQFRFQGSDGGLFNVAYRYRSFLPGPELTFPADVDPRIKQTDVSTVWPVNERWSLLARWNYDHSNERNLESFAGIEYRNCCATVRLIGREWVDEDELFLPNTEPERGIFVQFTLHGLGNITGGGLSSLLEGSIFGFREDNFRR